MLIGITGTDGAGKGTLVDYLVTHKGFVHYSARAIWIEELNRRNMELSRANMRLVANEAREKYGNDFLITYYLKKIAAEGGVGNVIIESIRAVQEVETLKAHGGILIAVDADQSVRYSRVQNRRSETDKVTFEQFAAHEDLEAHDPNPHGMQKQKVIAMADYVIFNNGTPAEFFKEIELLYRGKIANVSG